MTAGAHVQARPLTPNQQERRRRILHAAREFVAAQGYEGMIMRDVASAARVSPTTLYNLYNTKDELLLAALRDAVAESYSRTEEEAAEPGFDRLLAQLHNSVAQTREEPAYARAITQALLRATEGDQLVDVLFHRTRRAVVSSLRQMLKLKQLKPDAAVEDLAIALVGAFWANYMLWTKDIVSLDALERELKRSYLSLLGPVCRGSLKQRIERDLAAI